MHQWSRSGQFGRLSLTLQQPHCRSRAAVRQPQRFSCKSAAVSEAGIRSRGFRGACAEPEGARIRRGPGAHVSRCRETPRHWTVCLRRRGLRYQAARRQWDCDIDDKQKEGLFRLCLAYLVLVAAFARIARIPIESNNAGPIHHLCILPSYIPTWSIAQASPGAAAQSARIGSGSRSEPFGGNLT